MKSLSQSIYSQLPETSETQFAKTVCELQSEVRNERLSSETGFHLEYPANPTSAENKFLLWWNNNHSFILYNYLIVLEWSLLIVSTFTTS